MWGWGQRLRSPQVCPCGDLSLGDRGQCGVALHLQGTQYSLCPCTYQVSYYINSVFPLCLDIDYIVYTLCMFDVHARVCRHTRTCTYLFKCISILTDICNCIIACVFVNHEILYYCVATFNPLLTFVFTAAGRDPRH